MKIPKQMKTYCKKCKKHTVHKVTQAKGKNRGALTWGSIQRAKKRGRGGVGNKGRWGSKPAISKWKRTGAKTSKKTNLILTCNECKSKQIRSGQRAKKVELA